MRWMKCWAKSARRASLGWARIHLLLLALLIGGAFSQEATFHSQSNVVVIPALVKSAKGDAVYGLRAKDFVVEDDGVEQAGRLGAAAEGGGVTGWVASTSGRRAGDVFHGRRRWRSML